VGACGLLWSIWKVGNDFTFNKRFPFFAGYFFGYLLDSYVVNPTTAEGPPRYGYWLHPVDNGSTGFV
jgi:hypothetical protein